MYKRIGDGVAIANETTVKVVREVVKRSPTKHQVTVALCGALPWEMRTWNVMNAVVQQTTDAVVMLVGYSQEVDAAAAKSIRNTVEGVDFVMSVAEIPGRKATTLRAKGVNVATGASVLEDQWNAGTKEATITKIMELVMQLVKHKS